MLEDISETRRRSKSLDWAPPSKAPSRETFFSVSEYVASREKNNNIIVSEKIRL